MRSRPRRRRRDGRRDADAGESPPRPVPAAPAAPVRTACCSATGPPRGRERTPARSLLPRQPPQVIGVALMQVLQLEHVIVNVAVEFPPLAPFVEKALNLEE